MMHHRTQVQLVAHLAECIAYGLVTEVYDKLYHTYVAEAATLMREEHPETYKAYCHSA